MKAIIDLLVIVFNFLGKASLKIINKFLNSRYTAIISGRYEENYFLFGLISIILICINFNKPISFFPICGLVIYLLIILLSLFIIISDWKSNEMVNNIFAIRNASFALIYFTINVRFIFPKITLKQITIDNYYFFVIALVTTLFFSYYYFILKYCDHWFKLALNSLFTPIAAIFFYGFIQIVVHDIYGSIFVIKNNTLLYIFIIFVSIVLMNLSVWFIPYKRIKHLRVSFQFLVAVFSIISYLGLMTERITNFIITKFKLPIELSFEIIDSYVKSAITGFTLPYLIGTVIGIFFIELRELLNDNEIMNAMHK